jgi:diaminobutyrate-2-oxoglutarate transaminase
MLDDQIFLTLESNVRSYCRSFPAIFERAKGCRLWDHSGREYIDFFSGAGALNYGHNPDVMKRALIEYLTSDGIVHSLDLYSTSKHDFLSGFQDTILRPRQLDYKVQFTGPTGTNAVEAALKLARKVTGRPFAAAFTNGFHGMTLGSLAATANLKLRAGAGVPLPFVLRMPYDGFLGPDVDTVEYIARLLDDPGSGMDLPAAFIVETVQGEGGLHAASAEWLRRLAQLAKRHGILLIVDDIQTGCGRTGHFFSFEGTGVTPDIVCLSKSLSGFGLPMSLVLMAPDLDLWEPGEHNGTFRGQNLAFVTARSALNQWEDGDFQASVAAKSTLMRHRLDEICLDYSVAGPEVRGRGLMLGLSWRNDRIAHEVSRAAFKAGLLAETCGAQDNVLKLMPPLTIDEASLETGLNRVRQSVAEVCADSATPTLVNQAH